MNVLIEWSEIELEAACNYWPVVEGRYSGPPEKCFESYGGEVEILSLRCGDEDASFLLKSPEIREELHDLAYDACVKRDEADRREAEADRAYERAADAAYVYGSAL